MDREDAIYLTAVALVAVGAGLYSIPAGAIAAGVMLAVPSFVAFFRSNGKGPQK